MNDTIQRPDRTESVDYYFTYIDQVPPGDIRSILQDQRDEMLELCRSISEEASLARYAPNKWSIREVLSHINDGERMFVFRAFWFARELGSPLPSFDQDVAIQHAYADQRAWHDHVDEFASIRAASLSFFLSLPDEAWSLRGVASGNTFSVRALAFITAGHVAHHIRLLRERYL